MGGLSQYGPTNEGDGIVSKTPAKTLGDFETIHGQPKLKRLERELEAERRKVENINAERKSVTVFKNETNTVRFGAFGDTQYGSLYTFHDGVRAFYERCHSEGINLMLHTGDVLSGWKMFKGQEYELQDIGFDRQLERMANEAPKIKGMTTHFIIGNHDESFIGLAGVDVGKEIQGVRPDWIYEGADHAMIRMTAPAGVYDVMLLHPGGGTSYALSYRVQKTIEQLEGGTKPNMILIGHYHKAEMIPSYRNICAIQTGTFEWQSPYMVRKSLAAHVGGWIVEVAIGDRWNTIKAEFVAFYK